MPRLDADSIFGRLLDADRGGSFEIRATSPDARLSRRYLDGGLVLETTVQAPGGTARVIDCFTMRPGGRSEPHRQLLRVIEPQDGEVEFEVRISPRFEYGSVKPWIRHHGDGVHTAVGADAALVISSEAPLERNGVHDLACAVTATSGRIHLSLEFARPEDVDPYPAWVPDFGEVDDRLEWTIRWWQSWSSKGAFDGEHAAGARRSATVLKALTIAPTGAMAAAATTSLPEQIGGTRNWDYRFSWIRDSTFAVRSLVQLGHVAEADGFRRFVERSAAGSVEELQIMYGVGGEQRLTEIELDLEGYEGSRPVRVGNGASEQFQMDVFGEVVWLAWQWRELGHPPDDDYWRFLAEVVNEAARRWPEPDRGIWEVRGAPQHFVHSKAMAWAALEYGIRIAVDGGRDAPLDAWRRARDEIRTDVERRGYDAGRGVFVRSYGSTDMDAALLLLPMVGFVDFGDERMVRTVDVIAEELDDGEGLLRRYRSEDGLSGDEGAFIACAFWLAECLAAQGHGDRAREVFARAAATANDLGLFSEEFDVSTGTMLGNFPQGLTHLSHISAAVALAGTT